MDRQVRGGDLTVAQAVLQQAALGIQSIQRRLGGHLGLDSSFQSRVEVSGEFYYGRGIGGWAAASAGA
jgi:hypothetical protein